MLRERQAVFARLARLGVLCVEAQVVERLGPELINLYLAIKARGPHLMADEGLPSYRFRRERKIGGSSWTRSSRGRSGTGCAASTPRSCSTCRCSTAPAPRRYPWRGASPWTRICWSIWSRWFDAPTSSCTARVPAWRPCWGGSSPRLAGGRARRVAARRAVGGAAARRRGGRLDDHRGRRRLVRGVRVGGHGARAHALGKPRGFAETLFKKPPAAEALTAFASFLFQHNAGIGMLCFALGAAFGVPVVVLLFYNGLVLGAMCAVFARQALTADFLAWIAIHGTTSWPAVVICGAAGFHLAGAMIDPGRRSRLAALSASGRRAATLVVGAVVMLFVAAGIEAFRAPVGDEHARALRHRRVHAGGVVRVLRPLRTPARPGETRPVDDSGPRRTVETPEGVAVVVEVADLGTRAAALLIDLLIIVLRRRVGGAALHVGPRARCRQLLERRAVPPVLFFAARPYFLFFELRWQGQTPGKRWLGLRVVDRRGGALSPRAWWRAT